MLTTVIKFKEKNLIFSFTRAQRVLSNHLILTLWSNLKFSLHFKVSKNKAAFNGALARAWKKDRLKVFSIIDKISNGSTPKRSIYNHTFVTDWQDGFAIQRQTKTIELPCCVAALDLHNILYIFEWINEPNMGLMRYPSHSHIRIYTSSKLAHELAK